MPASRPLSAADGPRIAVRNARCLFYAGCYDAVGRMGLGGVMGIEVGWDRVVADCLAEATAALASEGGPEPVLARRIGEALHADSWSSGRFDAKTRRATLEVWPPPPDLELMRSATATNPASHPVMHHWLQGRTDVAMVSTVIDDATSWRNSEGYDLLRRGLGCTETGGIRLDAGDASLHMIGFARHVDFTADEVARLQVFRAPAVALVNHSEWLREKRSRDDWETTMPAATEYGLTARELQVLELLAEGHLASAIARRLRVSVRTVHCHLRHIYDKFGEHDRLSVVIHAQRAGVLASPCNHTGADHQH